MLKQVIDKHGLTIDDRFVRKRQVSLGVDVD